VRDIDEYDMDKIVVIPHKTINNKALTRFNLNQLIKVSYGNIYNNDRYYDGSRLPKCATIDSYIYPTDKNDVIEIFNGKIDESTSRVKLSEYYLDSLILDVYIEDNIPIFIETDNIIIGPFRVLGKDSEGYFTVEKNLWKSFGEYKLTDEAYVEFSANEIIRKVHIPSFNKFELIKTRDFKDNKELIEEFKSKLRDSPDTFKIEYIDRMSEILNKTGESKSIEKYLEENKRIAEILKNTEKVIFSEKELALLIPEINNIKNEIERLQTEEFELKNHVETFSTKKEEIQQDILQNQEN